MGRQRVGSPNMKNLKIATTKRSTAGPEKQVFTDFICNFVGVPSSDAMSKTHASGFRGPRGSE